MKKIKILGAVMAYSFLLFQSCNKQDSSVKAVKEAASTKDEICVSAPITSTTVPNGTYKFVTQVTVATPPNKHIGVVQSSILDMAQVEQRDYVGMSREWTITSLGNNEYSIINVNSGMALDIVYGSTADNTLIIQ